MTTTEPLIVPGYYASTLAEHSGRGLDLMGYEPSWKVIALARSLMDGRRTFVQERRDRRAEEKQDERRRPR